MQVSLTNIHVLSGFLMSRWKIAWIRFTKLHRGTQVILIVRSAKARGDRWLFAEYQQCVIRMETELAFTGAA